MADSESESEKGSGSSGVMAAAVVIIVILVIAGIALVYTGGKKTVTSTTVPYNSTSPTTSVTGGASSASTTVNPSKKTETPVVMTDPPEVPAGTSALVVAYSAVDVQAAPNGTTASGWTSASGSGSINLMNVTNSSRVVGYANLSTNETLRATMVNVTSAYIIVNGTKYNVTAPSHITANATGSGSVGSSSAVLVVMSPVVAATFNQNSTSFIMAPSARALVWQNATAGLSLNVGTTLSINGNAKANIAASAPNITIAAANLSASSDNSTALKVTVHDNSNSAVRLADVELYGPENVSASATGTAGIVVGGVTVNANLMAEVQGLESFQEASFVVSPAGTLEFGSNSSALSTGSTVVVGPYENATLTFNGVMAYDSGLYRATIKSGTPYRIVVVGQGDAVASTTVTGS